MSEEQVREFLARGLAAQRAVDHSLGRISFFVAGIPKTMSVGGVVRAGDKVFQKRRHTEWAVLVGELGRHHAPTSPMTGAVRFTANFFLPRPQNAKRAAFPLKRPDVDGLVHKLTDAFNGVFWMDDSQVVDFTVSKRFAEEGRCGVEIIVQPL